jgi:hypothetical protein
MTTLAIAIIIGSLTIAAGVQNGLKSIASAINPDYDE